MKYYQALVNRIANLRGHKIREILVWFKNYYLLMNELVKFICLSSVHIRALKNNLIHNTNKSTCIKLYIFTHSLLKIPTCFVLLRIVLWEFTSKEHLQNTDEL